MKKILGGLALGVLLAGPVQAADLPARMPVKAAPVPVVAVFNWTGCYIGVHGGWAWGKKRVDSSVPLPLGVDFDHDVDGWLVGGQVGCNLWQSDRWVFGIEGQAAWADIDGEVGPFTQITSGVNGFRTDANIIGSIAARLGYAFGATGQTLIFVKGGAAFINEQFFGPALIASLATESDKELRWGWMVGGGIEQALSPNWSIKAEYNYNNFGTRDVSLCTPAGACTIFDVKQHIHLVKVGINYRFSVLGGPVAPVAARF